MLLKLFSSYFFIISHIFLLIDTFLPRPHHINLLGKEILKGILSFDTGRRPNFLPLIYDIT